MCFNVWIIFRKIFRKNNLQLLALLGHREPLPLLLLWSLCEREPWPQLLSLLLLSWSLLLLWSLLLWWWLFLCSSLLWRTKFVSQPIGLDAANRKKKKRISNTINTYQCTHRYFLVQKILMYHSLH